GGPGPRGAACAPEAPRARPPRARAARGRRPRLRGHVVDRRESEPERGKARFRDPSSESIARGGGATDEFSSRVLSHGSTRDAPVPARVGGAEAAQAKSPQRAAFDPARE